MAALPPVFFVLLLFSSSFVVRFVLILFFSPFFSGERACFGWLAREAKRKPTSFGGGPSVLKHGQINSKILLFGGEPFGATRSLARTC